MNLKTKRQKLCVSEYFRFSQIRLCCTLLSQTEIAYRTGPAPM